MIIAALLTGCSYNYDNVSSENFVTETIEITNNLDEQYRVEYPEKKRLSGPTFPPGGEGVACALVYEMLLQLSSMVLNDKSTKEF